MKVCISLCILLSISLSSFAQQGINYKAIIKDTNGNVLASEFMNVQFTIHETSAAGTIVYQEDYNYSTDANGMIILNIGSDPTPSIGVFEDINWSADLHFLQMTITYSEGTINFDPIEFMAVPYALSSMDNLWQSIEDNAIAITEKVGIGTDTPSQLLSLNNPDNASIQLETATFSDTTGIRFENGLKTGAHTFYKVENINDALRISVDSDITAATDYDEIINISNNGTINTDGALNAGTTISAQNGTSINEFSTDGSLAGNSNNAVPTEAAVKIYVDNAVSSAETKTIMIPATAFNSSSSSFAMQGKYVQNRSGFTPLYAPIILPGGSSVSNIQAVFIDTDASRNLNLSLRRNNNISNPTILIASINSSGSSSTPQIVNQPVSINIDENTQYFMRVTSSTGWPDIADFGILMVKVTYTE